MGMADRVHLPGFLPDPARYVGLFDILALSSRSEQFPIAVVEGMAAGLPIAAPPVGDVPTMISPENAAYIARGPGEVWLRDILQIMVDNPAFRQSLGEANRRRAAAEYDEATMLAAYRRLYGEAVGVPDILG